MRHNFRYGLCAIALCAVVWWLGGCGGSDNNNSNTPTSTSYFPLTAGNQWVYQQLNSDGTFKDTCTANVAAQTTISGTTVFPVNYLEGSHSSTPFTLYVNWDTKGLELYEVDTSTVLGTIKATGSSPALFIPTSAPTPQTMAGFRIV